jgi:hypothetical protein
MYRVSGSGKSRAKAVLLSLIVTTTAFFFIIAPEPVLAAQPDAIPCPGGIWYWPNCIHFASTNVTNATNTTIFFDLVSSDAYVSLVFGNTTNYGFWAIKNVHYNNGQWFKVFLDFLQPSKTYYFKFTGNATGQNMGTYTGQWTTSSEGTYVSEYGTVIQGVVYNNNGTAHAPSGLEVEVQCTGTKGPYSTYGVTNSAGAYSIDPIIGASTCSTDGDGYFIVEIQNYVNTPWPGEVTTLWPGWWNESIVIWAAQFVNFYLPQNFVKYNVVQVQDYSNANASNGFPNGAINYTSGSTYTTSSSHCWTALFVFSGCSQASNLIGTKATWSAIGHNLVVTQDLWETGTVLFDALSRTFCVPAETYYAGYAPPVNEPASWPSGDNITASIAQSNSSIYVLYGWGGQYNKGIQVFSTSPDSGSVTVSSTTTTSSLVKGFSVEVGVSLYGVGISTTLFTDQWSQTSTSTVANTLSWTVYGNSQKVPICYVVYGVGGSPGSGSSASSADAIGIWGYSSTYSGGQYSCPLPS